MGELWLLNQIPPFVKLQTYFLWLIHSNGSTISVQLLDCRLVISCTIGAQLVLGSNFAMAYSCPNLHFVSLKGKLCCKLLPAVVVKKPNNPDMHFHVRYSLFSLLDFVKQDLSQIFSYRYSLMCNFRDFSQILFALWMYI